MRVPPICVQRGLKIYLAIKLARKGETMYRATLSNNLFSMDSPLIDAGGCLIAIVPVTSKSLKLAIFDQDSGERVYEGDTTRIALWAKARRLVPKRLSDRNPIVESEADRPLLHEQYDMNLIDCFDGSDEGAIWRVAADWIGTPESKPDFELVTDGLMPIHADIQEFEFQSNISHKGHRSNRVVVTFRTPPDARDFLLFASDPRKKITTNFFSMDSPAAASTIAERTMRMQSIDEQQAAYGEWIDRHLRALMDLEATDDATAGKGLHVLICAAGRTQADIDISLQSLEQQSHATWHATILTDDESFAPQKSERVSTICTNGATEVSDALRTIAKGAGSDHVCIIEAGDAFAQGALRQIANATIDPSSVILFDEDSVDANGAHMHPRFKSSLNKQLSYTENWIGYGAAFPAELVAEAKTGSDVAAPSLIAYALALSAIQKRLPFEHVPAVLLHTPISSWAKRNDRNGGFLLEEIDAAKDLLSDHLSAMSADVVVEDGLLDGTLRIRLNPDADPGKISVIIPTMDHADVLERCISSILDIATYKDIEIILVENNSQEDETFALYDRLQKENPGIVKVITWHGSFNYSAIINFGVAASSGEYLLLLNNDTEVIVPSFMEEMLALATIPEVGVVGAKLYFRDMLVQHAGMLIGPYGGISHVNQNFPDIRPGYQNRALTTSSFSSVTGACQMVRREVFDEVGGYDDAFAVGFNDADFCLKVRAAGYDVVFTPYAELYHYEFVSRGREARDDEKQNRWESERDAFFGKWEDALGNGDPLTNPNFDKDNWYYALPSNQS